MGMLHRNAPRQVRAALGQRTKSLIAISAARKRVRGNGEILLTRPALWRGVPS